MSDNTTSGDTPPQPPAAAPAETSSATSAPVPVSFGTGRGSGLARGKRPVTHAPTPTAAAPRGDYQPTAVQVIVAEREYQNPFAPATPPPAEIPAVTAAAPASDSQPVMASAVSVSEEPPAPVVAMEPSVSTPVLETEVTITPNEAALPAAAAEKAQITILPPAETKRPATSWESQSPRTDAGPAGARPRREDRPMFRPERPGEPAGEGQPRREFRDSRDARQPRDPRDFRENRENRPPRDMRDPVRGPAGPVVPGKPVTGPAPTFSPKPAPVSGVAPEAKPGGFIGWLKGLFGGSPAAERATPAPARDSSFRPNDHGGSQDGQRRRQRGGRGRGGFDGRGSRDGQSQGGQGGGQPRFEQGGDSTDRPFGQGGGGQGGGDGSRRRRHRGGRGRNRGDYGGPDSRGGSGDAPPASG